MTWGVLLWHSVGSQFSALELRSLQAEGQVERIGDRRGPRPLRVRDHRRVTARMDGDH